MKKVTLEIGAECLDGILFTTVYSEGKLVSAVLRPSEGLDNTGLDPVKRSLLDILRILREEAVLNAQNS